MKKKILFGILAFIIGILIAYYSESFFRAIIQDIYKLSTSNKIQFVGKNFYVFSNKLYFLTFGFGILILMLENYKHNLNKILLNVILSLSFFGLLIFLFSSFDASKKVVECTACNDGIRKLHWNDINYGSIIGSSALISIIPNLIKIIKRNKKASVQHPV